MATKTHIKFRMRKKTNPVITQTIALALKNKNWHSVAQKLSAGTRQYASVNLTQIDEATTAGDTIVVPGKVLGNGDITKKVRVCALSFSATAVAKLKKSKSEIVSIAEEIKINSKGEGIKILQ